jgi:hypothetical protein
VADEVVDSRRRRGVDEVPDERRLVGHERGQQVRPVDPRERRIQRATLREFGLEDVDGVGEGRSRLPGVDTRPYPDAGIDQFVHERGSRRAGCAGDQYGF